MAKDRFIVRSAGPVGAATFLSRVLGLVREQVFAYHFGAGAENDAFVAAFRIPNFFRDMFAEGALSAAFVPVLSETLQTEGKESAWQLANRLFAFLSGIVTAVTALGIALAPWVVPVITLGFENDPERMNLTILLTAVMFPFLLLISMAALLMGLLNATNRFFVPALASSVLNLAMIASGFVIVPFVDPPILGMALGVLLGGILQIVIQLPPILREGWRPKWQLSFSDPRFKRVLKLALPMIPGYGATQIVIFTNTFLATFAAAGSLSYLNYSYRLMHLPLGVFAVSVATVLLPTLSRQAAEGKMVELKDTMAFGLRLVFYLTLPAMTLFLVMSEPLCRLLYQYGDFDATTTTATALALRYRALGLFGFAGARILSPTYYSLQDTKTPFVITVLVVIINVAAAFLLIGPLDFAGIALATSIAGISNFVILLALLRKKVGLIRGRALLSSLVRIGIACAGMGWVCWGLNNWAEGVIGVVTVWERLGGFVIAGGAGTVIYLIAAMILRVEEGRFLFGILRERFSRKSV